MAYRELIKDFNGIRSVLRDQYVYGFHGRENCRGMSQRSYDDDARRIRNWLDEYTTSYYTRTGKKVYVLIDSRKEAANPLYRVFRAKSFTDLDITLHFCLLDMLKDGPKTAAECTEVFCERYLEDERFSVPDEGSVRNKLKEYEQLGILTSGKQGKKLYYRLAPGTVNLDAWQDAIDLFSESAPLGVIGSFLPGERPSVFRFKHRYLLGALDSEVMLSLLLCMREKRMAELTVLSRSKKKAEDSAIPDQNLYQRPDRPAIPAGPVHGRRPAYVYPPGPNPVRPCRRAVPASGRDTEKMGRIQPLPVGCLDRR